jgi:hypothetical protein
VPLPCPQVGQFAGRLAGLVVDEMEKLLKDIGKLKPEFERRRATSLGPCNLSPVKGFLGREREVAAVVSAVQEGRLVTVVGPPGEGKSSVAKQAAWELYLKWDAGGGVYFIDLAGAATAAVLLLLDREPFCRPLTSSPWATQLRGGIGSRRAKAMLERPTGSQTTVEELCIVSS